MLSQENLAVIDTENADVSDFSYLTGREDFEILTAGITCALFIRERDYVMEVNDFAVGFPEGNINGVAGAKHGEHGVEVERVCHVGYVNGRLYGDVWMRNNSGSMNDCGSRCEARRQVNWTLLSSVSPSCASQVQSVMSIASKTSNSSSSAVMRWSGRPTDGEVKISSNHSASPDGRLGI